MKFYRLSPYRRLGGLGLAWSFDSVVLGGFPGFFGRAGFVNCLEQDILSGVGKDYFAQQRTICRTLASNGESDTVNFLSVWKAELDSGLCDCRSPPDQIPQGDFVVKNATRLKGQRG